MIDLGLLSLFAVQHKSHGSAGIQAPPDEGHPARDGEGTYVLASSLALILLLAVRPPGGIVGRFRTMSAARCSTAGSPSAGLVLFTTFVINHFDLFGLARPGAPSGDNAGAAQVRDAATLSRQSVTRSTWDGCARSGARRR